MDIATSPTRVPGLRLFFAGMGVAFAYLLISLLLGFGSSHAKADDGDGHGGVLGSVTGAVSGTLSGVTGTVDSTLGAVTQAVTTTTQAVTTASTTVVNAAPAPVQPVVAPVVSTVSEVVSTVVQPVAAVTGSNVVSGVVTPVVDTVTAIPVVGAVADAVGVDDALTDVATSVDTTLDGVVTAVGDTATGVAPAVPPLVELPDLGIPPVAGVIQPRGDLPSAAAIAAEPSIAAAEPGASAGLAGLVWSRVSSSVGVLARAIPVFAAATAASLAQSPVGGILSSALPPGVCAPAGSCPLGSSGAGPGALALALLAPLAAHRAWVRRRGWEDDVTPVAPVYATDVSPD
ncbi:hypothetical protein AAIB33_16040 [Microbacterium sp. AZCO]|uniref:hypothetical protein n=1 Tax=Microbacterium sp. AZCO TaxID=3142976 RepID=UPI0031F3CC44